MAQRFSDVVIYDNVGLASYVLPSSRRQAAQIGYSGDHVLRLPDVAPVPGTALTVCRIEPENNLDMLIEGALASPLQRYTIVGNWGNSAYGTALREAHAGNARLELLDPIYDARRLAQMRESCAVYLHGHSVGGTNPSLVEMLYYDCSVLCFDVDYNRLTAGEGASYFTDAGQLAGLIGEAMAGRAGGKPHARLELRERYKSSSIARAYVDVMLG
jgi:glycosyltransferase involved in cell wall biosynthesis